MFDHDLHHTAERIRFHHGPGREPRRGSRHGPASPHFFFRDMFGAGRPGAAVRRGEIRPLILAVLLEKPMHGYEVIQELEAQSDGRWRPSAGSVYPTLQQLADEGLVTGADVDGRRTYTLTEAGRTAAQAASDRSPWTRGDDDREPDIRQIGVQLMGAVMQVHRMGSPVARDEARRILGDARRQMYRLLADDEGEADQTAPDAPPSEPA